MPDWWSWTATVVGLLVLVVLTPVIGLVVRRRWLAGRGRVFDCTRRRPDAVVSAGWMLGVARFREDALEWYRVFSLSLRPKQVFRREETHVVRVRQPDALEALELEPGMLVAELGGAHAGVLLAMVREDMTAFSSWTEAGPPGGGPSQQATLR